MAGTIPPLFEITEDDHGGYVAVTAYTLLILMLGIVATRVFARWYIVRSIKADDYFLMAAALLALIQTVFVQLALDGGLGRKRRIVSDTDFLRYQKYEYGAHLSSVATIASSKISSALLVQSLLADVPGILAGRGLIFVIVAWAIASLLATAFQCSLPLPWDASGKCLNEAALHFGISSLNIITDLFLVILPCFVVWRMKMTSKGRRYSIFGLFATRIFVCIATGIELIYFQDYASSYDKTWSNINATICQQVAMNLSVIFTAVPSIGRLLVELQPAVNAFAITELHGASSNDKWALSSLAGRFQQDYVVNNRLGVHTSILGSRGSRANKRNQDNLRKEEESIKGLTLREDVIKQTIDLRMY